MSANVETMFYVREKPWHGLGTEIKEAPASADALIVAGLDWTVEQRNVYSEGGCLIPGYRVNTRSTDQAALGSCQTATRWYRTWMLFSLLMTCWARVSPMKPLALCRAVERSGCWHGCPSVISSPGTRSHPIWW